jgi:hypothetical protein
MLGLLFAAITLACGTGFAGSPAFGVDDIAKEFSTLGVQFG